MPEQPGDGGFSAPLKVWRPRREPAPAVAPAEPPMPLRCGGPATVDERFEHMRALKRERDEALERARAEAEGDREPERKANDDEDEQRALERFRNDRYAVKLLRQNDDAWGGSAAGTGMLG
ncbi:hypothetical protein ACQPZJ_18400 [Actinoplanes sp. CA-054009]